jgi:RimJ/RimL family protein N-acetyltransferase
MPPKEAALILTPDRLRLRCMEPRDIDPFVRALNDWDVQQWLAQPPFPYRREHGEAYLAIMQPNHAGAHPTAFVMADKASDAALGAVAIDIDDDGVGTLGYWLDRPHWGHGYTMEAVRALIAHAREHPELRRIVAVTDPENQRSQRVLGAGGLAGLGLQDRASPSRRGAARLLRYELVVREP